MTSLEKKTQSILSKSRGLLFDLLLLESIMIDLPSIHQLSNNKKVDNCPKCEILNTHLPPDLPLDLSQPNPSPLTWQQMVAGSTMWT